MTAAPAETATAAGPEHQVGTALVLGTGSLLTATVSALLDLGEHHIRAAATDGTRHPADLAGRPLWSPRHDHGLEWLDQRTPEAVSDLLAGAGLAIHVTDDPAAAWSRRLDEACRRDAIPLVQVVACDHEVWLWMAAGSGERHGFAHDWRRVVAMRTPARPPAPGDPRPDDAIVASHVVREVLRWTRGARRMPSAARLARMDPRTLRFTPRIVVRHPFAGPVAPDNDAEFLTRIQQRTRSRLRVDPPTFTRRVARFADALTGIFTDVDGRGLAQYPLRVACATVSDPVGLLGPATPRPVVTGTGLDIVDARNQATLRALAVYGSLMVDPRRLVDPDGHGLFAPGADPAAALSMVRQGIVDARVRAVRMTDGLTRLVEAGTAFPELRATGAAAYPPPCGLAGGYEWADVLLDGLLQQCRRITVADAVARPPDGPPVDLRTAPLDDLAQYCRSMLAIADERVAIYDVTGPLGVPTFACTLDGRTITYAYGSTTTEALSRGLRSLVLYHQSCAHGQPVYRPGEVPQLPSLGTGRPRSVARYRTVPLPELVARVQHRGYTPVVIPLDHDPEVHELLPHVARVVTIDTESRSSR